MNIDRTLIMAVGIPTICLICIWIVMVSIVFRPYPKLTLEQVQEACIRSAVVNDDFEKVEKCLLITKDQGANK